MFNSRIVVLPVMLLLLTSLLGTSGSSHYGTLEKTRGESPPSRLDAPFSLDVNVSDDPFFESQVEPSMVVDDLGYIHVGWIDRRSGLWRVRYARSTNGGQSFEASMEMPDATHPETGDPVLAYASGVLYYAWISFDRNLWVSDVVMRVSLDRGSTWSNQLVKVSDSPGAVFSDKPWIAARDNNVYAVYTDLGVEYEIRFAKSTDQGATFEPSIQVNYDTFGLGIGACIDIGPNDEIYVSWWDSSISGEGVYFSKSLDGGLTFTPNKKVASTPWSDIGPYRAAAITSLSVGPTGEIYIVWTDFSSSDWDIKLSASLDGGETFSAPITVNDDFTTEIQFMPWVDVDPSGKVHIAWYDNRTQQLEIMYANSTDFGMSFGPNLRVSDASFLGERFIGDYIPLVADSWTNVHVAWCDRRNDNNDIYYSQLKGPGMPGPPPAPASNVSARLEGSSLEDVNITWTLSADDGSGQDSVVNYSIFFAPSYNGSGMGYLWLANVPAGTDHYVAPGIGHGDTQNYFFIIQANDVWGQSNRSLEQSGKFVRQLEPGWNLISPPLSQENSSIEVVLQTVPYQCVREFAANDGSDRWKQSCVFKRYGEVEHLDIGDVLWINITQTSNWTIAGSVLRETTIWLRTGWSLIGVPAFSGYDVARLKTETGAIRVEGFSNSDFPHHLRVMFDFEPLQPGFGYWLRMTADSFWTVENL
ncbi:MAG: sialidase family protein [Thermoplasmata archaeon]